MARRDNQGIEYAHLPDANASSTRGGQKFTKDAPPVTGSIIYVYCDRMHRSVTLQVKETPSLR